MPTLHEIQRRVADALLAGDVDGAVPLVRADTLPPAQRLQIHRHHFRTSLTEALKATYPVVCRLVDERFFAYAAHEYIRTEPPRGPCLFEYGVSFADFLAGFEPARALPYLPDIARLEWALNLARHAAELPPVDREALRAVPADRAGRLVFAFQPSVARVVSAWPIDRIWQANQPADVPDMPVDLAAGGVCLEVRRKADAAIFRALAPDEGAFRRRLAQGAPLEAAAAAMLATDRLFDVTLALRDLLREGLIVGFSMATDPSQPEERP